MSYFIVTVLWPSASATGCRVEACLCGVRRRHQDPGLGLDNCIRSIEL